MRTIPDVEAFHWESDRNTGCAFHVELPKFLIARYPVTVAQWRVFYWACSADRPAGTQQWTPRRPDGLMIRPLDERSLDKPLTRPVTWVSWFDAMAYCHWLTSQLRQVAPVVSPAEGLQTPTLPELLRHGDGRTGPWVITLPSEAEWEKAARADTASVRPWNGPLEPQRANYFYPTSVGEEPGPLRETSAVGVFASGRSPMAVEDLIGNVWEWTRSRLTTYPYAPDHAGQEHENPRGQLTHARVKRGGSFDVDYQWRYRSSNRDFMDPGTRDFNLGFRLVASPFKN